MCGIAGEIDWNQGSKGNKLPIFEAMQCKLRRRGPDQEGMYIDGPVVLIHSRLCVVDIENGKQPMNITLGDEEYVLIYNGELYNTSELHEELAALGHKFIGHSDTEVLLHSYVEWREDTVNRLNGIFSFAIWEKNRNNLFIARDRMGVKPFFYVLENNTFIFASEIKALLAHPRVKPEINIQSIAEIMLIGPGRTPGYGVFKQIKELLPASCGNYNRNGLKTWNYWQLTDKENNDSFEETTEKVRSLVIDSIERQLVSDVPVGTFLSGGLDSSIISSVASKYFSNRGKRLKTFSVDYKDNARYFTKSKFQPNSDDSYIKIMNNYLDADHYQIRLDTEDLVEGLFAAVDARDLPGMADVDSSLLLFCKEVKNNVTVALSGECADEIFGGYPWYRDKEIREKYGFPWAQSTDFRTTFLNKDIKEQINSFQYVDERYRKTIDETDKLLGCNQTESRTKEMVNLNFKWFMQTLLDRKDRMSMYSGLEVRVPFCDYRIAEYLYTVTWEFKDYNNQEKGLLRCAMTGLLPDEVLWRKKSPYPKTHNPTYLKAVTDRLLDEINDPQAPLLQFINKNELIKLITADNGIMWYGQLMTTPQTIAYFLQINYWLKKYKISVV